MKFSSILVELKRDGMNVEMVRLPEIGFWVPGITQYSKIRKKCNFKSTKTHCGRKSTFATEKSSKVPKILFFQSKNFIFW